MLRKMLKGSVDVLNDIYNLYTQLCYFILLSLAYNNLTK